MINEHEVKKVLQGVKYPGFERDIVSLGFVKEIKIEKDKVFVGIEIVSANPEIAKEVEVGAKTLLEANGVKAEIAVKQPKIPEQKSNTQSGKNIAPQIKNFVMVSSGKGGVGKSTTTVNLALALAKSGKKVGILDADIYGPNIPRMLGLLGQKPEIIGEKVKPLNAYGVQMMSMGVLIGEGQSLIWRGAMIMKAIEQLLRDILWDNLDILFIDMPPGTGDAQLTLAQSVPITCGICVTTPQAVALDDAERSLDMFQKLHIPIAGIVENMSGFICPDNGKEYDIFGRKTAEPLAAKYQTTVLAEIPIEPSIREGGDSGKPIVISKRESVSAKRYEAAAKLLSEAIEDIIDKGSAGNSEIQPIAGQSGCSKV